MEQNHRPPRNVRFGVFEADLEAGELRKHGLRLKLSEQPFQILAMLVARPGEVVSREVLRERLWPSDTFVDFDHGLNNAVMRLREVLGDSSDHPRFIETLPRRGYRFIAPVGLKGKVPESPTQPAGATEKMAGVPVIGGKNESRNSEALLSNAPGQPSRPFSLPRIAVLVAAVRACQPVGELEIAFARLREQQHAQRLVALGVVRDAHVAAEHGLHAAAARRAIELDEAERVAEIGER